MFSGPDQKIESFLKSVIGCEFRFQADYPVDRLDIDRWKNVSRLEDNTDTIAAIAESMRQGLYVSPIIVREQPNKRAEVTDGRHRSYGARKNGDKTIAAYVIKATDIEANTIASCGNHWINGQGLSEAERREHFLTKAHSVFQDLNDFTLRNQMIRQVLHLLGISGARANDWVRVARMKNRAQALGLKLPLGKDDARKLIGVRTDAWLLAIEPLTDEELQKYWTQLTNAPARKIADIVKTLEKCTSSAERSRLADEQLVALTPTVRSMSQQGAADRDRVAANQIRSHGAGLLKIAPQFVRLANNFPDVKHTLQMVAVAILRELGEDALPDRILRDDDDDTDGDAQPVVPAR